MNGKTPLYVHCGGCSHEWAAAFLPLSIQVIAKIGKSPCPMCGSGNVLIGPFPKPTEAGDAVAWLTNGDTGTSSETIWSVLMGRDIPALSFRPDVPHDPDDFGRCYRLLKVMPSWRNRLPEVAARHAIWQPFVAVWDELTELYEQERPTGSAPTLYQRLAKLQPPGGGA